MGISEMEHGKPANRKSSRVGRGTCVNEEGGCTGNAARRSDGSDVTRIPPIFGWSIASQNSSPRFAQSRKTYDLHFALNPARSTRSGGPLFGGHEPSVHEYNTLARFERSHHPVTCPALGQGIDEGLPVMKEVSPHCYPPVFDVPRRQHRPLRLVGQGYRSAGNAHLDPFNEVQFPGPSFKLPDAQGSEHAQTSGEQCGQQQPLRRCFHGVWLISPVGIPGIILAFKWYMIQMDPEMVMMTITAVNT